ncbi:MAG: hypothetical protein JNM57_08675 [Cyclobacteriaceae bacterium]|nr:hypothetical protein [Cyclobacteriaceae bacterium]
MKTLISILFTALMLLAEVGAVAGNHWGELERVKTEESTSDSSDLSENLVSGAKIKNQVRKPAYVKKSFIVLTYDTTNVILTTSNSTRLRYALHRVKPHTSPIYLNNEVFLI